MLHELRAMPGGVRVLLVYAFALLAFIGLTLPLVVAQAVEAPISAQGMLWMLLLAYLVFTVTLILQRKQAAYALSVGLATLSVPLVAVLFLWAGLPGALIGLALAAAVFGALRRRSVRAWFVEP